MSTSKLQKYTGNQLRKRFAKYGIVENTRPDWLISTKGERLELDFYLERLGIAIEVQGGQHFEFTPVFHASEWDFQEQVRRDKDKLEVCQQVGIDLLYVCKKSDVEVVLTACYDVLKPITKSTETKWKNITPAWINGRIKMLQKDTGFEKLESDIARWHRIILREKRKNNPRFDRVAKYEKKLTRVYGLYTVLGPQDR